jgi:chemotaxis protein MotA
MDIATLIGLIFGLAVIGIAIATGGDVGLFVNLPGILIVLGGTLAATLIKFRLVDMISAFALGMRTAFREVASDPNKIYKDVLEMAAAARKSGVLALQDFKIDNALLRLGIRLVVDGHSADNVRHILDQEINQMLIRQEKGETMFRGIGDSAPAFGMIGTLVGLVQMLANLSDPGNIGPAMAVALLTTFYGALIANLIAIPIADKLAAKTTQDRIVNDLVFESVMLIHQRKGPQVIAETLAAFLPAARAKQEAA